VTRAAVVANATTGYQDASRVLERCELIDADADVVDRARALAGERLRTLDAIHLASALLVGSQELIAYDTRLLRAAEDVGLATASPGA
jgi:predicted nucleic acid-binding protein